MKNIDDIIKKISATKLHEEQQPDGIEAIMSGTDDMFESIRVARGSQFAALVRSVLAQKKQAEIIAAMADIIESAEPGMPPQIEHAMMIMRHVFVAMAADCYYAAYDLSGFGKDSYSSVTKDAIDWSERIASMQNSAVQNLIKP